MLHLPLFAPPPFAVLLALAALLALAVDRWLGEPRAAFHPVVWTGQLPGLGVRLRKPGAYTLNAPGYAPQGHYLGQAVRLAGAVVGCTAMGAAAALIALAFLQPVGGF